MGLREIKPELWRSISCRNVGKRKSWSELWMAVWMEEVGVVERQTPQQDLGKGVQLDSGVWLEELDGVPDSLSLENRV